MNRLLASLIVPLVFSSSALAGEILFVPPDVFYLSGAETLRASTPAQGEEAENLALCREYGKDKNRLLLDDLGRITYLAMSDAVSTFNGSPEALRTHRHYRAQSMAFPSCGNNSKIKKFYRGLGEPGTPLLQTIKAKNGLDAVIWGDFRSRDITDCLAGNRSQCSVAAIVCLFDGNRVMKSRVDPVFVKRDKKFTKESLDGISSEVARLLAQLGTPAQGQ